MRATAEERSTVGKMPANVCVSAGSVYFATRTHSHQNCEATNRNLIQGRYAQVSEPIISETVLFGRIGKSRACAVKDSRIIQGELQPGSGSRPCAESRRRAAKAARRMQQSAEVVVLIRRTPATPGRTKL